MALSFDTNQFTLSVATASSGSNNVTIGASCTLASALVAMNNGTGNTVAVTLGGNAPTLSTQTIIGADRHYAAAWCGAALPAAGTQALAYSGGDAGDAWGISFATWSGSPDTTTPFDGFASAAPNAATPDSISVNSTATGVVHAMMSVSADPTVAGGGTQIGENSAGGFFVNQQYKAGTGAAVSMSWTAGGTTYELIGINLREAAAASVSVPLARRRSSLICR
jgi:hypothetical protein